MYLALQVELRGALDGGADLPLEVYAEMERVALAVLAVLAVLPGRSQS